MPAKDEAFVTSPQDAHCSMHNDHYIAFMAHIRVDQCHPHRECAQE